MNYLTESEILRLDELARQLRIDSIKMIYTRQSGHPGGALPLMDYLSLGVTDLVQVSMDVIKRK